MCERDKHDFIIAGVGGGYMTLVCRHCGEQIKHEVSSDFKLTDLKLSIEEKQ